MRLHKGEFNCLLSRHASRQLRVLRHLVKVKVLVNLAAILVDDPHVGHVFVFAGNAAQLGADGGQLGGTQVHVGDRKSVV